MPENNFKSSAPEDLNTFKKMGYTFKSGLKFIKNKPIIIILLSVTLFYGLSSEGYDRLSNMHFLQDTMLPKLGNLKPVIAYLATSTFRTINEPIFSAWLNGHIDDKARSTVLSINGQINSLGQILGGPIIGIIATNISVSMGIACTSLLVTPVLVLYIVAMIMDKKVVDRVGGIDYEENN